jgi:hypothetical protein
MKALNDDFNISKEDGFQDGGYFTLDEALDKITYSQDKALVRLSFEKFREMLSQVVIA